jgi:hypothetical protein
MLWAGRSGVSILARTKDFPLFQNVHTGSGAHPTSYSMGTGALSQWENSWGVKLNTHLSDGFTFYALLL